MTDQINKLPEDGMKSSIETSRYTENKWISRKNQNKLYFLHLIFFEILFLTSSICLFQFIFSSRIIPRNFMELTLSSVVLFKINMGDFCGIFLLSR